MEEVQRERQIAEEVADLDCSLSHRHFAAYHQNKNPDEKRSTGKAAQRRDDNARLSDLITAGACEFGSHMTSISPILLPNLAIQVVTTFFLAAFALNREII